MLKLYKVITKFLTIYAIKLRRSMIVLLPLKLVFNATFSQNITKNANEIKKELAIVEIITVMIINVVLIHYQIVNNLNL